MKIANSKKKKEGGCQNGGGWEPETTIFFTCPKANPTIYSVFTYLDLILVRVCSIKLQVALKLENNHRF